jgi:hypothetical protein
MNLEKYTSILKQYRYDKMNIKRYTEIVNSDGSTDITMPANPTYSNVPCKISFQQIEKQNETGMTFSIDSNIKIFCATDIDLKDNDYIEITRTVGAKTVTYKGNIGMPALFQTHQEAELTLIGHA